MVETKIIKKLPVSQDLLESSREDAFQQKVDTVLKGIEEQLKLLPSEEEICEKTKANDGYLTMEKRGVRYRADVACLVPDVANFKPMVYFDRPYIKINGANYKTYHMDLIQPYMNVGGIEAKLPTATEARKVFKKQLGNGIQTPERKWNGLFCKKGTEIIKFGVQANTLYHLNDSYDYCILIPFVHLNGVDSKAIDGIEAMQLWIAKDLTPSASFFSSTAQKEAYQWLKKFAKKHGDLLKVQRGRFVLDRKKIIDGLREGQKFDFITFDADKILSTKKLSSDKAVLANIKKKLLECDQERAALDPYDEHLLTDLKRGHWDLWNLDEAKEDGGGEADLGDGFVARNPASDVKPNFVAIDFGTKSTVVAFDSGTDTYMPLQIGSGTYSQGDHLENYENPTIVHFLDIPAFLAAYQARDGRPETSWETMTVSHTAKQDLDTNGAGEQYTTFFEDLKHWCGEKNGTRKIRDQRGHILDLPGFLELAEADFNPVDVYAYYIGLYLNNMLGEGQIYLHYLMSFPVTYELDVREAIRRSFERGLKKSLPTALLADEAAMKGFSVRQGASEPAAYAATALREFGFEPDGKKDVYYSVFDFGGGTTDFDFGMLGEPGKDRYEGRLTHFGANGDRTLGGENLLRLLAFEVFKANRELLLHPKDEADKAIDAKFSFTWPAEKQDFLGSKALIKESQEAHQNMHNLMEKLRPIWEAPDSEEAKNILDQGMVQVLLFSDGDKEPRMMTLKLKDGEQTLDLTAILRERIERGVRNFFIAMKEAFDVSTKVDSPVLPLQETGEIAIFLAGNSSRSPLVKEIFGKYLHGTAPGTTAAAKPTQSTTAAKRPARNSAAARKAAVATKRGAKTTQPAAPKKTHDALRALLGLEKNETLPKFQLFPPLGTEEAAKRVQVPHTNAGDDIAPTAKTGVAYGLLECRANYEVVNLVPEGSESVSFRYYIGRRKHRKFFTVIDMNTPMMKWYPFIDASDDFDLLYTDKPEVATNEAPTKIAQMLNIALEPAWKDENATVYVRAVAPRVIEWKIAAKDATQEQIGAPTEQMPEPVRIVLG